MRQASNVILAALFGAAISLAAMAMVQTDSIRQEVARMTGACEATRIFAEKLAALEEEAGR